MKIVGRVSWCLEVKIGGVLIWINKGVFKFGRGEVELGVFNRLRIRVNWIGRKIWFYSVFSFIFIYRE